MNIPRNILLMNSIYMLWLNYMDKNHLLYRQKGWERATTFGDPARCYHISSTLATKCSVWAVGYYSFWVRPSPPPHHNDSESRASKYFTPWHGRTYIADKSRLLEAEEWLGSLWASPLPPPHHNCGGSRGGDIIHHDTVELTPQTN